jgi:catechol 2,3-dioxygenase-like lactoylglutathione lyase family enzyme
MPELLGIDNVMFAVRELAPSVAFYEACGFTVKFKMEQAKLALFAIGAEEPGLMIRVGEAGAGRFWVEVRDADAAAGELKAKGIVTTRLETATGITIEATDPSGNVVGFADYSKRPKLARAEG